MLLILYEDDLVSGLRPLTELNPAFSLWFGGERLIDRAKGKGDVRSLVRRRVRRKSEELGAPTIDPSDLDDEVVFVNSAAPPGVVEEICGLRRGAALTEDGRVVVARLGREAAAGVVEGYDARTVNSEILAAAESTLESPVRTVNRTWEICPAGLSELKPVILRAAAREDVESGEWADRVLGDGALAMISPGAEVEGSVTVDVRGGPVLLERGSVVGAGSTLRGPLLIGRGAKISPCSHISGSFIGEEARVGGEVFSSVVSPYSNKAHFGFLGHSYVGSWVNLGAGTVTSNLKNTYGEIRVRVAKGGRERTGLIKLGAALGDHTKSSIGTMIYTGLQIGAAAQLHGFVTERVPPFTLYARTLGWGLAEVELESVIRTYRRMAARRGVEPSKGEEEALARLFEETSEERISAGVSRRRVRFG